MTDSRIDLPPVRRVGVSALKAGLARRVEHLSPRRLQERASQALRFCVTHRRVLIGWASVALALVVGVVGGLVWATSGSRLYTATGTSFVKFNFPSSEMDPFSAQQFVTQRIDSYAQLGTSPAILVAVQKDVPGYTLDELRQEIAVSAIPGTVLLQATVTDANPYSAARLADSTLAQLAATVTAAEGAGGPQTSPILIPQIQPAIVPSTSSTAIDKIKLGEGVGVAVVVAALLWAVLIRRRAPKKHDDSPEDTPVDVGDTPEAGGMFEGAGDPAEDADPKALDRNPDAVHP